MTVTVTQPSINVREKLAELDKPTGIAGEAMLRAETPQEQFNLIGAGRRNLIINGGFDVWQRGTSFSTGNEFTADRWYANSGTSTLSASRQAFTVGQTEVPYNPSYFLRVDISGQTTRQLYQKIEDIRRFSGQTVTVTYWAKADVPVTPDVRVFAHYDGSGAELLDSEANVRIGTSWKKYTHVFNIKSFTGKTIGSSSALQLDWTFFDDSDYTFDIAQVQLELGKVATPFEHRSYGEELALCQRYFLQYDYTEFTAIGALWSGNHYASLNFPTTMRTSPTCTNSGAGSFRVFGGGASTESTGVSYTSISKNGVEISITNTRTNQAVFVRLDSSGDYQRFDAEL